MCQRLQGDSTVRDSTRARVAHEVLRDEKLGAALEAHVAKAADSALGQAASAVLESTGEPGAGAVATGTTMSESELQRIIDRAGLASAPTGLHPLAYRDRHGDVQPSVEVFEQLAETRRGLAT